MGNMGMADSEWHEKSERTAREREQRAVTPEPTDELVERVRHFIDHTPFTGPTSKATNAHMALTELAERCNDGWKAAAALSADLSRFGRENEELAERTKAAERERDGLIGRNQFLSTEVLRLDILRGAAEAQRDEARDMNSALHADLATAYEQRDELVEALERLSDDTNRLRIDQGVGIGEFARAALAKHRDPYGPIDLEGGDE